MLKTYSFKTANGANVKLTAGDVTYTNEIVLDGDHTGIYNSRTVLKANVNINGKNYGTVSLQEKATINGVKYTKIATLHINGKAAVIQVPAEMFDEIYAGELKRTAERVSKLQTEIEQERKYLDSHNAILKAMEE